MGLVFRWIQRWKSKGTDSWCTVSDAYFPFFRLDIAIPSRHTTSERRCITVAFTSRQRFTICCTNVNIIWVGVSNSYDVHCWDYSLNEYSLFVSFCSCDTIFIFENTLFFLPICILLIGWIMQTLSLCYFQLPCRI